MKPIELYDLASNLPGKAWSSNTWKTRYSLALKGLPFKTTYLEYPDIPALYKTKGFKPTSSLDSGFPFTLPAIYDPNTSTAVADSAVIAEYLDTTYPDTPKLFPVGSHALQHVFLDTLFEKLQPIFAFVVSPSLAVLSSPESEEYFKRTRSAMVGKPVEEAEPKGEEAEVQWGRVKGAFDTFHGWLEKGQENGPYFLGQEPAFVDLALVSVLQFLKKIWGEDHKLWKSLTSWNDGRWAKLVRDFEKYEVYT